MKLKILFFCLLFILSSCKKNTPYNQIQQSLKKPDLLETNNPSFNPKTGEFIIDKYTIGLWHLNEGKGDFVLDKSKYENDGIILNPRWSNGIFSKALNLNGRNNAIEVEDDTLKLSPSYAVTVECWILLKESQSAPYPTIIGKPTTSKGDGKPSYVLSIVNHQHDRFPRLTLIWSITPANTNKVVAIDSKIYWKELAGKWHYIAGTYNGEYTKIYIDGDLKAQTKLQKGTKLKIANKPLYIGKIAQQDIDALIDEVRISNVARSHKAIKEYWQKASTFLKR